MARHPVRSAERSNRTGLAAALRDTAAIFRSLTSAYRPEQHYMRGPGPAWHAKHGASDRSAMPDLAGLHPAGA